MPQVSTTSRRSRHNRNRVEIIHDILSGVKNGEIKTHIMQKANLSYDMLRYYLSFLLERGLIEKVSEGEKITAGKSGRRMIRGAIYKVTQKGESFLEAYEQLESVAVIS